jgi:hypothetical protein
MFAKEGGETKVTYSLARKDMVGFVPSCTFLALCVNWEFCGDSHPFQSAAATTLSRGLSSRSHR